MKTFATCPKVTTYYQVYKKSASNKMKFLINNNIIFINKIFLSTIYIHIYKRGTQSIPLQNYNIVQEITLCVVYMGSSTGDNVNMESLQFHYRHLLQGQYVLGQINSLVFLHWLTRERHPLSYLLIQHLVCDMSQSVVVCVST